MTYRRNILITGAAGFIGSHVAQLLCQKYPDYRIVAYDLLTYAGNLDNLAEIASQPNYHFVHADICQPEAVEEAMRRYQIDTIIHLAAESHVDRSIADPFTFARTNVMGTLTLLHTARKVWEGSKEGYQGKLFYHISTDEVYGSLQADMPEGREQKPGHWVYGTEFFTEDTAYRPHSPYSASKASSDHFVRAFHDTYGMPVIVTNCSNNYGPRQYPEKLLPLFISNIVAGRPLPVYGQGLNVRDWLYVTDHARAIDMIVHRGRPGDTYNIGGHNECTNIEMVRRLIAVADRQLGRPEGSSLSLISHVTDRLGHDARYAIDSTRLQRALGWYPTVIIDQGLEMTVQWYLAHREAMR